MRTFLGDNLDYFCELYEPQGLSPREAIEIERGEIARIKAGDRGGPWARTVVLVNALFYDELARAAPRNWGMVRQMGREIISAADADLDSLTARLAEAN
jgi:hypothetical protein